MELKSDINNLEIDNNLNNQISIEKEQNRFLDTMIGKAINTGLDIGIRAILPDLIEDQIINIKDNLVNYGFKDGVSKTVDEAINFGKSSIGIITGNFDNISQMQLAVKKGGIIDTVSNILDFAVDKMQEKNIINYNIAKLIKQGKNTILNNIENNIEKSFIKQENSLESLNKYINKWQTYYNNKDFNNMEIQYKKIKKELSNLVPLENSLNQAHTVENIHNLIKNNGKNFNLSQTEQDLLKKLS